VGSGISRIVIKSDHAFRRIPAPGQVVGVLGKSGLFIVMNVERKSRMAQLMEKAGKHRLVDVPFSSIRTFNRNLAQAIHRFIDSGKDPQQGG